MEKRHIFTGTATALVTPMNSSGVDYDSLGRLIDWQIQEGVKALVVCATTGEAPTLTDNEHCKVLDFAIKRSKGRVPVIAGTGSNDTAHAIMMTQFACTIGADAVLCVTPYYNRPTQSGLIASFTAIADAATAPVILYNVPSRTGTAIEPETYGILADHPNICAVKEAGSNWIKIMETFRVVGDRLDIYSGNDDTIVPLLSMGGKGVISVLSNPLPAETVAICDLFRAGKVKESAALQLKLLPLIDALFSEVNPVPVKAAMAAMGYGENYLRLPLTPMEADHEQVLLRLLREAGAKLA